MIPAVSPAPVADVDVFIWSTNCLLPERAIVPRFDTSSSRDMPMPLSTSVSVFATLSVKMLISSGSVVAAAASPPAATASPVTCLYRYFSSASLALEISSRMNTSLSV